MEWDLPASGASEDAADWSGSRQAPKVLSPQGPLWAFERVIALNSLCLMTQLYEELLNKGRWKHCQVRLQPGLRPSKAPAVFTPWQRRVAW